MISTTGTQFDRRHDLDALRAIAMLLGIVLHAAMSLWPLPYPIQDVSKDMNYYILFLSYIHGFRLPLFFLLSGFFTAMLWRKRGLASLLWHRFRRIFLPMVVFWILVMPAIIITMVGPIIYTAIINQGRFDSLMKSTEYDEGSPWHAIASGDIQSLQTHIENGFSLHSLDPELGMSVLSAATINNQTETVEFLIQNGADVNRLGLDNSTALHLATLFGQAESAAILLENGSDLNIRNYDGAKPPKLLIQDDGTLMMLSAMYQVEKEIPAIKDGQDQIADLFQNYSDTIIEESNLYQWIIFFQNNHLMGHLWFLWYLCFLVAFFAIYAVIADALQWQGPSGWWLQTPFCYLWLIPLTMTANAFKVQSSFGPDTPDGMLPMENMLFYYAIFFGFGALYFDTKDYAGKLGKGYWLTLALATFIVFPIGVDLQHGVYGFHQFFDPSTFAILSNFLQSAFVWMMSFGLIGFFIYHFNGESKRMRYLSDSAYFLYIAHLPPIFIGQWIVKDWNIPGFIKIILITAVVSVILLLVYHSLVRYTFIGTFLNGKRTRPTTPVEESAVSS